MVWFLQSKDDVIMSTPQYYYTVRTEIYPWLIDLILPHGFDLQYLLIETSAAIKRKTHAQYY